MQQTDVRYKEAAAMPAARGYAISDSIRAAHQNAAKSTLGMLVPIMDQIERDCEERFGVEAPE